MNRSVGMLESDVLQRHIAGVLNVSQSLISGMWNHHLTHGDPSHRHVGGRDRAVTQHQDCFFVDSVSTSTVSESIYILE